MSCYINAVLKSEITCIPQILKKIIGKYYNNALSNGTFWIFVIWCAIHFGFDKFINVLLKRMNYMEYIRKRLTYSLWILGFYGVALFYCGACLSKNEFKLLKAYKSSPYYENFNNSNFVLGNIILIAFYLHSSIWEVLNGKISSAVAYFAIFVFVIFAYSLRVVEFTFSVVILLSAAHIIIELTKITKILNNQESDLNRLFVKGVFTFFMSLLGIIYLIAMPLTALIPFATKAFEDPSEPSVILIFIFAILVWVSELVSSPFFGLVLHWLYHCDEEVDKRQCPSCIIECSLFGIRDDEVYNIKLIRLDIKKREEEVLKLRKPKARNVLIQTLKCMVAIKRKISEKRNNSDSSDSEDSDKSFIENKDVSVEPRDSTENDEYDSRSNEDSDEDDHSENDSTEEPQQSVVENRSNVVDGKLRIRFAEGGE